MALPPNQQPQQNQSAKPPELPKTGLSPEMMETLKQGIAMGVAMAQQNAGPAPQLLGNGRVAPPPKETCSDCRQDIRACKGEHVDMVVYTRNERWADSFQGVRLNGVTYRSNGPGHYLKVPKQNDIAGTIAAFESNEEVQANGRKASHYSGTQNNFQPAAGAWR